MSGPAGRSTTMKVGTEYAEMTRSLARDATPRQQTPENLSQRQGITIALCAIIIVVVVVVRGPARPRIGGAGGNQPVESDRLAWAARCIVCLRSLLPAIALELLEYRRRPFVSAPTGGPMQRFSKRNDVLVEDPSTKELAIMEEWLAKLERSVRAGCLLSGARRTLESSGAAPAVEDARGGGGDDGGKERACISPGKEGRQPQQGRSVHGWPGWPGCSDGCRGLQTLTRGVSG